jgi:serine-type D-Ala-D-Ala carboxypeptidase/endopeptidase
MIGRLAAIGVLAVTLQTATMAAAPIAAGPVRTDAVLAGIRHDMEQWRLDAHVPGLVYGIVLDGGVVAIGALGVENVTQKAFATPDSRFRIASMSKAFTALAILKLRDSGKLSLDASAETYVPELKNWQRPTSDSRSIRVRDLLNHSAGLVTDDPWGDRQQPMSEADFTALLRDGVPFSRATGTAMEYSNLGYAILGRIITNVSGQRYQDHIRDTILTPLGMAATGHDISAFPATRRALGYRWQDGRWLREPDMADGAFGAMGGIETTARDYARWVAFLLSAWPPRDGDDDGPVARATVREIAEGSNFVHTVPRAAGPPCRVARAYGMGWRMLDDCDLGFVLTHGGGFPGYGSNVVLVPDKGLGVFVLTNRTYAAAGGPAMAAALALRAAGVLPMRPIARSPRVTAGYELVRRIWANGSIVGSEAGLAPNVLLDRDAVHWSQMLAGLKAEVGTCPATEPVEPISALQARFTWVCDDGRISGTLLLAPTIDTRLQALEFARIVP